MNQTESIPGIASLGVEGLKRNWGWVLTLGIVLVIIGAIAVIAAAVTTLLSVIFLGTVVLAGGIAQIIQAFTAPRWRGFFLRLLVGILYTVVGVMLLLRPALSAMSLTLLLAGLLIGTGIFKVAASLMLRYERWGWTLLSGIIGIVLGGLILSQWPASSFWIIGLFVGIDLIFDGWSLITLSLVAHNLPGGAIPIRGDSHRAA